VLQKSWQIRATVNISALVAVKQHSARTGRTVFSQYSAAVVRRMKQTTVYKRYERGLSKILLCLQWYKLVLRTRLSTAAVQYPVHAAYMIQ